MIFSTQHLSSPEIERHHLQGLSYVEQKNKIYEKEWKKQFFKNQMVADELKHLEPHFETNELSVTLLKGFALLGDVYTDWGSRFASDVDILVVSSDLSKVIHTLNCCGYRKREEQTWLGNNFKATMVKQTPLLEITIEIHTKLYWHIKNDQFEFKSSQQYLWYKTLGLEDQLIHLCGHLAFQHTFIKLFWLFDIQRFIRKYKSDIHWEEFWVKAKSYNLKEACQLCIGLLSVTPPNILEVSWKQKLLRKLCNQKFLIAPREHPLRYFFIKLLIKDRFVDNFRYIFAYFLFKSDQIFQRSLAFLNKAYKGTD